MVTGRWVLHPGRCEQEWHVDTGQCAGLEGHFGGTLLAVVGPRSGHCIGFQDALALQAYPLGSACLAINLPSWPGAASTARWWRVRRRANVSQWELSVTALANPLGVPGRDAERPADWDWGPNHASVVEWGKVKGGRAQAVAAKGYGVVWWDWFRGVGLGEGANDIVRQGCVGGIAGGLRDDLWVDARGGAGGSKGCGSDVVGQRGPTVWTCAVGGGTFNEASQVRGRAATWVSGRRVWPARAFHDGVEANGAVGVVVGGGCDTLKEKGR